MKLKQLQFALAVLIFDSVFGDACAMEIRTSQGTPKIGDRYQNSINLDNRRKLILPDGIWEVNNVFDDKEANWHAPWKVITLISDEPTSPFRMTVVRFFSTSVPSWPKEDCENKNNQYSFGHDTTGTKGSRSICSSFFEWSSPQRSIRADLPRMFPFYWEKALSKLPDEFVKTLPQSMAHLEIISSKSNGLYIRQDVLIDLNSAGTNASEIRQSSSSGKVESSKSNLQKWRIAYVQAMSRAYLDSESIDAGSYAFKAFSNGSITNTAKTEPTQNTAKNQPTAAPTSTPTTERLETQLALERKQIEKEKALFEEQKQLLEQRQRLEEEKKKLELEALQSQKELLAIQEERRQLEQRRLEKLQEDKLRQERLVAAEAEAKAKLEAERAKKEEERVLAEEAKKREEAERKEAAERKRAAELAKAEEEKRRKDAELFALAEKRKQQEEEKRAAAEAKKAEEDERRKLEAYKKAAPTIEVTQSEPDEFGAVILDIVVSKPTKSLTINGESEGASKDGKYRVKRILKKIGKTNFSFAAFDEYGNKVIYTFNSDLKTAGQGRESAAENSGRTSQTRERNFENYFKVFSQDTNYTYIDCNGRGSFAINIGTAITSLASNNKSLPASLKALKSKSYDEQNVFFDCTMVGIESSHQNPQGEFYILLTESKKEASLKDRLNIKGAHTFEFQAAGGFKALANQDKEPVCYLVKYSNNHNEYLTPGAIKVEIIGGAGFPKAVKNCGGKITESINTPPLKPIEESANNNQNRPSREPKSVDWSKDAKSTFKDAGGEGSRNKRSDDLRNQQTTLSYHENSDTGYDRPVIPFETIDSFQDETATWTWSSNGSNDRSIFRCVYPDKNRNVILQGTEVSFRKATDKSNACLAWISMITTILRGEDVAVSSKKDGSNGIIQVSATQKDSTSVVFRYIKLKNGYALWYEAKNTNFYSNGTLVTPLLKKPNTGKFSYVGDFTLDRSTSLHSNFSFNVDFGKNQIFVSTGFTDYSGNKGTLESIEPLMIDSTTGRFSGNIRMTVFRPMLEPPLNRVENNVGISGFLGGEGGALIVASLHTGFYPFGGRGFDWLLLRRSN